MLRIKELNLTCMINDSERITEKLGPSQDLQKILFCFSHSFWIGAGFSSDSIESESSLISTHNFYICFAETK